MCSYRDGEKGLKKREIQDDGQIDGEELDSILNTLEEVENKFHQVDNSIGDVQGEIKNSYWKFSDLVDDILFKFERFERQIEYEIRKNREQGFVPEPCFGRPANLTMEDPVACHDLHYLCEEDTKEKPTNLELIKKIKEKSKELERMTDEKFTLLFNALQEITKQFQEQEKQIGNISKRFNDHEEFIRTHLTIA